MIKKSNIIYLVIFLTTYALFQYAFHTLVKQQERIDAQQTKIIQENVQEGFNTFLKLPTSIGILGSEYFSTGNLNTKVYSDGLKKLLEINKEILGLSILDQEGLIVRVYPLGTNPTTIGRITQNIEALKDSFSRGEVYWFSRPFALYQGSTGFAIYVPIIENKKLKGWFAPIISTELFSKRFELTEYVHIYDLIINDVKTNTNYFTSSDIPYKNAQLHTQTVKILGRELSFQSWRKEAAVVYHFPWYVSFALAIFITLIVKLITFLFEQRKRTQNQLNDINALLRMSSADALSKLVEMHKKFNATTLTAGQKENFSGAVTYLKDLLEQIDLLQTMSRADGEYSQELHGFLPILVGQINNFSDVIAEKKLNITFEPKDLEKVMVSADGGPLQNSVLSSILSHSIIYAKEGTRISIENKSSDDTYYIVFHTHDINRNGPDGEAIQLDRRLEVARRMLNIYQGQLTVQNDLAGGMLIRIMLPVT